MWGAWCARCHADDGSGKVNEPTVTVEPMDFTDCKVTSAEPDADWERAIAKGGPGVGLSPQMPGFEDSLTPEQITLFVSHMRGFCKEPGWPSGNTNFPRPILTEKAFPENELVILPAISHFPEDAAPSITEGMFKVVYERRFGKRSMFEIGVPLVTTNAFLTRTGGLGDIEVAIKHALYTSNPTAVLPPPRIVSLGLEVVLPTGDRFKDHGSGTPIFEPYVSAGMMIRDWYVQTQLKAEFPVDRLRADRAVVYNAYVGRDTSAAPNTWTIGVELNGEIEFPLQAPPAGRRAHTSGEKRIDGHRRVGGVGRHDGAVEQTRRTGSAMGRLLALGILGTLACASVVQPSLAHTLASFGETGSQAGSITGTITTTAKGAAPDARDDRSEGVRRPSCPTKPSSLMRRAAWRTPS